ncbi:cytochrome P450 [Serendipita vermifera]|nr:cytochrome P450 [Serendipita vermifera]
MSTIATTLEGLDLSKAAAGLTVAIVTLLWLQHNASKRKKVNEPDLLPGSLPFIGHLLKFANDPNGIYQIARNWTTNEQPVSLSLLSQRIYVVLASRDVSAVWRSKAVSFSPIVEYGLKTMFGVTPEAAAKLHLDVDGTGDMYENQHEFFRDSLAQGENLDILTQKFAMGCAEDIRNMAQQLEATPSGEVQVELMVWVRYRLGLPSTHALVGSRLLKVDPEILDRLARYEGDFHKLSAGFPRWMMGAAHANLDKIIDAFEAIGKDPEMLPWIVRRMEMCEARGLSPRDVAASMWTLWMALQANAVPTSFWLLYHLILHPEAKSKVEAEVAPAFDADGNLVDIEHLVKRCSLLNSMIWETLRWGSTAVSVRSVQEDFVLAGKTLYEGAIIMLPVRPYHLDPEIFGDDADKFVPDRFTRDESLDPRKKNPGLKAVKPFGGGQTLCPGRHFAFNEITTFVALALRTFDFVLPPSHVKVEPVLGSVTAGIVPPDREVHITIKAKGR